MKNAASFLLRILFLFSILLISASSSLAEVNLDSMDPQEYKSQLEELEKKGTLSAEEKQNKDDIAAIISILENYTAVKNLYENVNQEVLNAQKTIMDFKRKKTELTRRYDREKLPDLSRKTFNEISELYRTAVSNKESTESLFNEENKKITYINSIADYAQEKGFEFQEKIASDKSQLTNAEIRKLEGTRLSAEIKYMEYYIQFLQFLNISHNRLLEITSTRVDYYRFKLQHEQKIVDILNKKMEAMNNEALQKEEEILQKETSEFSIGEDERSELSDSLVEANNQYRTSLAEAIKKISIFTTEDGRLSKFLEATNKIENDVNSQIDTFSGSLFLSQMLAKQKKSIPWYYADFSVEEAIGNIRIEQYDVNARLGELESIPDIIADARLKTQNQWTEKQLLVITKLLDQQYKILNRYKEKLNQEINLLVNIKMKYSLYVKSRKNIYTTINKKVFWLQSNQRINISWFKNLPTMLKKEFSGTSFYFSGDHFLHSLFTHLPKLLLLALLSIIIWIRGSYIAQKIELSNHRVGSYRHDRHLNSIIATLLTLIRSAPWAFLTIILCKLTSYCDIRIGTYDIGLIADNVKGRLALIALFASFSIYALREGGLFPEHFSIHTPVKLLRKHLMFLGIIGILYISCTNKNLYPNTYATDVVGEIIFLLLLTCMQYIMLSWLYAVFKNQDSSILEKTFCIAFSFIPAVLIVELILGYFYSVVKVTEKIIDTYFIIFCVSLVYRLILRSLSITSRRLAFQRKLEERDQKRKEKARQEIQKGDKNTPEENVIDNLDNDEIMPLSEISNQSISIVNISIFTISVFILYFLWRDFINILSYIDNISLWSISDKDPSTGTAIIKKITMGNLLIAIYSLIMTTLIVKNLPGLLEITILNRFAATRNVSYSVKTLLTYVILAIGVTFTLSELGITWNELQWLVAALSVGLGFGLQEIFGNFVSGIIILFERPIRLGDIVTIDGTTGVVTKIRIRATTIMDFNKRDLIVPNKTFITAKLTNWSLNDICLTRMIVDVGVSYKEDTNKVHDLLMDIAKNCKYVMKNPQPYVVFTSFGDSNLNFQLRFYINSIKDYDPSLDTINSEIYRRFKESGIEIAYNQLEVLVKNTQTGQEIRLNNDPPAGNVSTPAKKQD